MKSISLAAVLLSVTILVACGPDSKNHKPNQRVDESASGEALTHLETILNDEDAFVPGEKLCETARELINAIGGLPETITSKEQGVAYMSMNAMAFNILTASDADASRPQEIREFAQAKYDLVFGEEATASCDKIMDAYHVGPKSPSSVKPSPDCEVVRLVGIDGQWIGTLDSSLKDLRIYLETFKSLK